MRIFGLDMNGVPIAENARVIGGDESFTAFGVFGEKIVLKRANGNLVTAFPSEVRVIEEPQVLTQEMKI